MVAYRAILALRVTPRDIDLSIIETVHKDRGRPSWRPLSFLETKDIIWGGQSFGILSWTGNETISRNPRAVPIFAGFTAYGAFKAADLARLCNVLAAVINRAAFTGSMMTQGGF